MYPLTRSQWNAVRGQAVYAHFTMQTDADLPSTVYLDDVQLNVRSGGSPGDINEPNDAPPRPPASRWKRRWRT